MQTHHNSKKIFLKSGQQNNLIHFPNMSDHLEKHKNINYNINKNSSEIQKVIEDFEVRFQDFEKIKKIVKCISFSFKNFRHISYGE